MDQIRSSWSLVKFSRRRPTANRDTLIADGHAECEFVRHQLATHDEAGIGGDKALVGQSIVRHPRPRRSSRGTPEEYAKSVT